MFSRSPSADRTSSGPVLQADYGSGALTRPGGVRCATVAVDFLCHLHTAVAEQFGEDAQDVLYRCGYEWGLRELLGTGTRLVREASPQKLTLAQIEPKFALETWWKSMRESGHGLARIDCSRESRGIVVIELNQCPAALTAPTGNRPTCHSYAGLFAGALSFLDRAERHATEIQCRALGHSCCQFVVGPGSEVDGAEAARQQGTPAAEILRRLT